MKLEWSPLAIERVLEIAQYIALDKPSVAQEWAVDVFNCVEKLKIHPKLGRMVPEIKDDDYRELIHGNYRIVYKIDTQVSILTVRHCRQILSIEDVE